jgi:hypothetical protein
MTISVLPSNRLPYSPLSEQRVETFFSNIESHGNHLDPPPTQVETGCLRRAWQRLQARVATLKHVLGLSTHRSLNLAAEFWTQMCASYGALSDVLRFLSQSYQRSLLADYRCLRLPN